MCQEEKWYEFKNEEDAILVVNLSSYNASVKYSCF
jgi:hypothetical protein